MRQGWVVASFAFVAAVACGTKVPDAGQSVTEVPVCFSEPRVTPSLVTLHSGDTLRVRADACASPVVRFRWSSSDTAVGTVDSANGLIHARGSGVATIFATEVEDSTVKGAALLQVVP